MRAYKLDDIDITYLVSTDYTIEEEINLIGEDKIKLNTYNLELFNLDGVFNPYNPNSIFYGRDISDSKVDIFDNFGILLYTGQCKDYDFNADNNTVNITVCPTLDSILDRTFIQLEDDITPAEAIKNLLIYYGLDSYIDYHSFNYSQLIQEAYNLYVDLNYFIENTTTIYQAIVSLSNDFGCNCYLSNGKIYLVQIDNEMVYEPYYTIPYYAVGSVRLYNNIDNIKNQFSYQTDLITLQDYYTQKTSRDKYGERAFGSVNLTNGNNIASVSFLGLQDVGQDRIGQAAEPLHFLETEIDNLAFPIPISVGFDFKLDSVLNEKLGYNFDYNKWLVIKCSISQETSKITAIRL